MKKTILFLFLVSITGCTTNSNNTDNNVTHNSSGNYNGINKSYTQEQPITSPSTEKQTKQETIVNKQNNETVPEPIQEDILLEDIRDNKELTFNSKKHSLKIEHPEYVDLSYGANWCYDNRGGLVPLKIYDDGDVLFIRQSFHYQKDENRNCIKIDRTLDWVREREKDNTSISIWEIKITDNINNDEDLNNFLKDQYGQGCKLKDKIPLNDTTYTISILGDGKDFGETECPLNYITRTIYSPAQGKIASWDIGQDCNFAYDRNNNGKLDWDLPDNYECSDNEIKISFTK